VSTYTLTGTEYTETLLFHVRTDQIGGKDTVSDLSNRTLRSPATQEGGRLQFTLPIEAQIPVLVEGNRMTVSAPGGVDVWEKVL
jgi:hypothetical protein